MAKRGITMLTYTDGIVHGYLEEIVPPSAATLVRATLLQELGRSYPGRMVSFSDESLFFQSLARSYNRVVLQVTSNGKAWSYALRPAWAVEDENTTNLHSVRTYLPPQMQVSVPRNRTRLTSPYRDMVEWALKDMTRRAKLGAGEPGALMLGVAYEREAPAEVGKRMPGPCGPILYTGYKDRVGVYGLDQIHETIAKAVADCIAIWSWQTSPPTPWKPTNLEVMIHYGEKSLGLAFAPGTGRERNKRTISFNEILFKTYDLHALWRVAVHELCHHYRDEVFSSRDTDLATAEALRLSVAQAVAAGKKVHPANLNTHDSIFIRELARVDPQVRENLYSGIYFTEYADPSLVADAQAQAEARFAKFDWSPAAGRILLTRLKTGNFSLWWVALGDGRKIKLGVLGKNTLVSLIGRLSAAVGGVANPEMPRLVMSTGVTYDEMWPGPWPRPDRLNGLLDFLADKFNIRVIT